MQHWERSFELAAGGGVSVDQRSGRIQITGWDEQNVKVTASSDAENLEERLHVLTDNGSLRIEVQRTNHGFFGFLRLEPSVNLEVMVPRGTPCAVDAGSGDVEIMGTRSSVQVDTGSGDIEVSDIGWADLDTGSGDIAARSIAGALSIKTGSGDVEVSQVGGELRIDTGSGDLSVFAVEGSVELETGSGAVEVQRVRGKQLEIETGNGGIQAGGIDVTDLSLETGSGGVAVELAQTYPSGAYRIETGSGTVRVVVPPQAALHVDLRSDSGRITTQGLELRTLRQERGEFEADMNGGGAKLTVETGSGGISLGPTKETAAEDPAMVKLAEIVQHDAALASSDQIRRILDLVKAGTLTTDQAEKLLRGLTEGE